MLKAKMLLIAFLVSARLHILAYELDKQGRPQLNKRIVRSLKKLNELEED